MWPLKYSDKACDPSISKTHRNEREALGNEVAMSPDPLPTWAGRGISFICLPDPDGSSTGLWRLVLPGSWGERQKTIGKI